MDLTGSLVDTHLKIYPSKTLIQFLKSLPDAEDIPSHILKLIGRDDKDSEDETKINSIQLTIKDFENLSRFRDIIKSKQLDSDKEVNLKDTESKTDSKKESDKVDEKNSGSKKGSDKDDTGSKEKESKEQLCQKPKKPYLTISDVDWLYEYLNKKRPEGNVPYLHELLEGCNIEMPENSILKRNPVLEERCVKLRAQQEAREYRKMTKSVDNVRMRYPEDSISYQMKQINRQLIAIGQFIISIFAGFLFGFRGVEWMVGNLDFGFRLLLGVMCALVIALAEIYFLAKKLNEELNIAEAIQLGGPPKFENEAKHFHKTMNEKEHQD